jgi:hypothetical protein
MSCVYAGFVPVGGAVTVEPVPVGAVNAESPKWPAAHAGNMEAAAMSAMQQKDLRTFIGAFTPRHAYRQATVRDVGFI